MSNYVKITSIGARPYQLSIEADFQDSVDKMIEHWKQEIDQVLPDKPDLIVLPEACDRPPNYSLQRRLEYYKIRGDQVLDFLAEVAGNNHCYIAYSAAREVEDGTWRNSTRIIDREGKVAGTYNKNHLIIEETTQCGILCGKEAPVIKCDFGNVACAICFDLNFDELRLKYVEVKPDIILFSSMYHGGLMQSYWAYSCRSHFVGCIAGAPNSIISPVGQVIAAGTNYFDYITAAINLDCCVAHLDYNWDKLKKLKQKYGPKIRVTDPGFLGSVLLSSEAEEFTIKEMVKEFEIELLDDYMVRVLAHRNNPENMEP
jgi:predicted amidohydrolase